MFFKKKTDEEIQLEKNSFYMRNFVKWFTSLDVEEDVEFDLKQIKYREQVRLKNEV